MGDLRAAWLEGSDSANVQLDSAVDGAARADWAVGVLLAAQHASPCEGCAERELEAIVEIGLEPKRWREAHQAFQAARAVTLRLEREGGDSACRLLVDVGESAAKVIYNAGDFPAPFDSNSGVRLIARAGRLAAHLNDIKATDMLWHAVARVPTA